MRDSFITLMILVAEEAEVDMTHLLSYPITRYPLSISYFDGLPMKTDKAVLLRLLENFQCEGDAPSSSMEIAFDVTLVDGGRVAAAESNGINDAYS